MRKSNDSSSEFRRKDRLPVMLLPIPTSDYELSSKRLRRLKLSTIIALKGLPFIMILMAILIANDDAAWTDNLFVVSGTLFVMIVVAGGLLTVVFDQFGRRVLQLILGNFTRLKKTKLNKSAAGRELIARIKPNEWELDLVKNASLWSYSCILVIFFIVFVISSLIVNFINPLISKYDLSVPFIGLNGAAAMMLFGAYMMIVLPIARIVWTLPSLDNEPHLGEVEAILTIRQKWLKYFCVCFPMIIGAIIGVSWAMNG